MKIRPCKPEEASEIIRLWKACNLVFPQNIPEKDIKAKLAFQPGLFLVGIEADRIVASVMVGYDGHRGWLNYLAVSPDYRKKGLGRMIVTEAEKILKSMGCPKINLQVRTSNMEAIHFYTKCGFSQDEVLSFGKRLT